MTETPRRLTRRTMLMGIAATPLLGMAISKPVDDLIKDFVKNSSSGHKTKLKKVLRRAWEHFEAGVKSAKADLGANELAVAKAALAAVGGVIEANVECFDEASNDDPGTNYCLADCGNIAGGYTGGNRLVTDADFKKALAEARKKHGSKICKSQPGHPGYGC